MSRNKIIALAAAACIAETEEEERVGHRRRLWVHDILRGRHQYGAYHTLVRELHLDEVRFQTYFRLSKAQFEDLLGRVAPAITRQQNHLRETISPDERLCICLRYLATGDSYHSIAFSYRVGVSTVAGIVRSVCEAIWECLLPEFMPVPGKAEWAKIAMDFKTLWAFPNCVGAMDGKHVIIAAPPSSGSLFYNYKGTFSIVLLAVVDARYRFRMVDVGAYGRNSDGGTLMASTFGTALRQESLDLPGDASLPGAQGLGPMPHVFLADEAFPLRRNLLRPYPGHNTGERRVFNFRLSHARRMVECCFGILASQWRLYRRVLGVSPAAAETIVKATCILHNFLRWDNPQQPTPPSILAEEPSQGLQDGPRLGSNNASQEAIAVRNQFAHYFVSPAGRVPWQEHL